MKLFCIKNIALLICLALSMAFIASCGKKPATVKAPPHVAEDPYPKAYPAQEPIPGI